MKEEIELGQQDIPIQINEQKNTHQINVEALSCKFRLPHKIQEECVISRIYGAHQPTWLLVSEILAYICTGGILLILFHWFKDLRFKIFFQIVSIDKADKVVIYGPDGDICIAALVESKLFENSLKEKKDEEIFLKSNLNQNNQFQNNNRVSSIQKSVFEYRYIKYQYRGGQFQPYGLSAFDYKNNELVNIFKEGLTDDLIKQSYEENGLNKTDIPDKGVPQLIVEELFSPFYMFQIGSTILWIFEGYRVYAYIIIFTSTLSIIVKILEEHSNLKRLRDFSFFRTSCEVMRRCEKIQISSEHVGFGEKIFLNDGDTASCDVIVIQGSAIVNESMLTGESVPIVKTALDNTSDKFNENKQNVIYCGSLVQQVSPNLECIVIRIGFETLKGNLIRSIMYPKQLTQLSFKNDSGKFILILGAVALISFLVSLPTFIDKLALDLIAPEDVVIRCLDLITISVPPALPTCLTFGISFSLKRLRLRSVFCINPEKINICGIVRTICFDKTGTLTEEALSFKLVAAYLLPKGSESGSFQIQSSDKELSLILKVIMGSCHSVMVFNGKHAGDPLDIEMFENTGCSILLDSVQPNTKGTRHKVIDKIQMGDAKSQNQSVINVLKIFQFESEVERMSAVVQYGDEYFVVTKGSPEKIKSICVPNSIPARFDEELKYYTREGYRVIALSYKPLLENEIEESKERDIYENNLLFAGFIVFENKLKLETISNISLLQSKMIQIHMVTGDNPLTSLSVAKQCQILSPKVQIGVLDSVTEEKGVYLSVLDGVRKPINSIISLMMAGNLQFVMTGSFFHHFLEPLKKTDPLMLSYMLSLTKVYARMKPDQKQTLIRLLQSYQNQKRYSFIGMCGDGANDCQALKDADMGISLGEAEASIAASFTSKVVNISIIEFILREGRCCLATSFQCFKFMSLYSIIQCTTTAILYQRGAIPGDYQFLYWDLVIIVPLAFLIGLTEASDKLTNVTPAHRLFSHQNLFSVIGMGLIQFGFLIIAIAISSPQSWYIPPITINQMIDPENTGVMLTNTFDNAILFWVSNFQYIFSVVAFSIGSEHKKTFLTNRFFTSFLVLIFSISVYSLFSQELDYTEVFEISAIAYDSDGNSVSIMPYSWRFVIAALIVGNTAVTIFYEKYFLPLAIYLFEKRFPDFVYTGEQLHVKPSQGPSDKDNAQHVSISINNNNNRQAGHQI